MANVNYVLVDLGHDLDENWQKVRVILSDKKRNLFDDGYTDRLLVELASGERIWIDYWKEIE